MGFYEVRQKGSHLQLKRGNLLVTVPMHSTDLSPFLLHSILRQARISTEELLSFLSTLAILQSGGLPLRQVAVTPRLGRKTILTRNTQGKMMLWVKANSRERQ